MVRRADLVEGGPLAIPRASFQAVVARADGFERRIADRVLERLDVAVADVAGATDDQGRHASTLPGMRRPLWGVVRVSVRSEFWPPEVAFSDTSPPNCNDEDQPGASRPQNIRLTGDGVSRGLVVRGVPRESHYVKLIFSSPCRLLVLE